MSLLYTLRRHQFSSCIIALCALRQVRGLVTTLVGMLPYIQLLPKVHGLEWAAILKVVHFSFVIHISFVRWVDLDF